MSTSTSPKPTEAEKAEAQAAEAVKTEAVDKKIEALDEEEDGGEDIEELRRKYLLRRFWHTASRFWTDPKSHMAWLLSAAAARHHPAQPRRLLCDEPVESQHLRRAGEEGRRDRPDPVDGLFRHPGRQRRLRRRPGLRAHDPAAALARMADRPPGRPLAEVTAATTSSTSCSGDHENPEYRIADDVRIATESPVDFVSGVTSAFLSAATFIVVLWTIGGALNVTIGGIAAPHPRLSGDRGGALCA